MADSLILNVKHADSLANLSGVTVSLKKISNDSVIASGTTDGSGNCTLTGLTKAESAYLELTKAGYYSYTKTGQYVGDKFVSQYSTDLSDNTVSLLMIPVRARTAICVHVGEGPATGDKQLPLASATVVVKTDPAGATVETLTTDTYGVAFLDDSLYTPSSAYYAVITKATYNSRTIYFTFQLGVSVTGLLSLATAMTMYNVNVRLMNPANGQPMTGQTLQYRINNGILSEKIGDEFYYAMSQTEILTSPPCDINGLVSIPVPDLAIFESINWKTVFGYPDFSYKIDGADLEIGAGDVGKL